MSIGKPQKTNKVVPLLDLETTRALSSILQPHNQDTRPVLLFIAGPNGSGKTTLFEILDSQNPGRSFAFINADLIGRLVNNFPAPDLLAQKMSDVLRAHMLDYQVTFATETVFSDEKDAKLQYLRDAQAKGFRVIMVYVTLANWALSKQRVNFRVQEGMGHDVPADKLKRRFIASLENCRRALYIVDTGIILDNSSANPNKSHKLKAIVQDGKVIYRDKQMPTYVASILPIEGEMVFDKAKGN